MMQNKQGGLLHAYHKGDSTLMQQFVERSKKQHASICTITSAHISFLSSETQIYTFHMT